MRKLRWSILPLMMLCGVLGVAAQDADSKAADKTIEKKADEKADETADDPEGKDANAEESEGKDDAEEEAEPDLATLDKRAPDFTLKNASGDDVKLSDYKGKIIVLEWINLDCPWCKKHYEDADELVKLQKDSRKDDVVWLTICSSGEGKQGNFDADTLKKRMDKVGLKAEFYLHDPDGSVGKKYEAKTTPHCYVIDKEFKLRYRGALDNMRERRKDPELEELNYAKAAIESLAAGKKLDHTDTKPYG